MQGNNYYQYPQGIVPVNTQGMSQSSQFIPQGRGPTHYQSTELTYFLGPQRVDKRSKKPGKHKRSTSTVSDDYEPNVEKSRKYRKRRSPSPDDNEYSARSYKSQSDSPAEYSDHGGHTSRHRPRSPRHNEYQSTHRDRSVSPEYRGHNSGNTRKCRGDHSRGSKNYRRGPSQSPEEYNRHHSSKHDRGIDTYKDRQKHRRLSGSPEYDNEWRHSGVSRHEVQGSTPRVSAFERLSKSSKFSRHSDSSEHDLYSRHVRRSRSPYSDRKSKGRKRSRDSLSVSSDNSIEDSGTNRFVGSHSRGPILLEDGAPVMMKKSGPTLFEDGKPVASGSGHAEGLNISVETGRSSGSRRVYSNRRIVGRGDDYAESISDDSLLDEGDGHLRNYEDFRIHAPNTMPVSDTESLSSDSQDQGPSFRQTHRDLYPQSRTDYENMFFPLPCISYNRTACYSNDCKFLHICRHYLFNRCKFVNSCSKSHSFFSSQPYAVLNYFNKKHSPVPMTGTIHGLLKERTKAQIQSGKTKRLEVAAHKPKHVIINRPKEESVDECLDVDPSFDARNYAVIATNESDSGEKNNEYLDTCETVSDDDEPETENVVKSTIKEVEKPKTEAEYKKKTVDKETLDKKKDNDDVLDTKKVESVSSDEEKCDETIEDDKEEVKMDVKLHDDEDLESVSSEGSFKVEPVNVSINAPDIVQKQSLPPAVPIGMNDPLVFSKPLKNQPTSQSTSQAPQLTPPVPQIAAQTWETPVTVVPLLLPQIPLHLPPPSVNNLPLFATPPPPLPPRPTILQEVVNSLPPYQYIPPPVVPQPPTGDFAKGKQGEEVDKEVLKVMDTEIKTELEDKDPELKQPIKGLWKFPHASMLTMTVIHFVTETEAYKEEFIAELVRILLTIHLPYVTMKKLMSVIKEKISISIQSIADLRKILDMYPDNFQVLESADSDDDDDDLKIVKIKAKVKLNFCEKHGFLPFALNECNCNALHMCKFYFFSECNKDPCKFGHKLKTDHNIKVLKNLRLHRLTGEELLSYLRDEDNRTLETVPSVCRFYNREKGCYKGDNVDSSEICHCLHVCYHYMKGKCTVYQCERSHSIHAVQPLALLKKLALDPDVLGNSEVEQKLKDKVAEAEKIRTLKIAASSKPKISDITKQNRPAAVIEKVLPAKAKSKVADKSLEDIDKKAYYNPSVPAICKFYNNVNGCRKKDWGDARFCFFLHVCEDFVNGDCKQEENCKRSHDFFSGQAAMLLKMYNIDLDRISRDQILRMLNTTAGAPVQIPMGTSQEGTGDDGEERLEDVDMGQELSPPDGDENRSDKVRNSEHEQSEGSGVMTSVTASGLMTSVAAGVTTSIEGYTASDIESVIKHIMSQNQVKK